MGNRNRYFSQFPLVLYTLSETDTFTAVNATTNIFQRLALRQGFESSPTIFFDYLIKDDETPDILAHHVYGSADLYWIVLMSNQQTILDPQSDWPISTQNFPEFLIHKYGTLSAAMTTVTRYEKTIVCNHSSGSISNTVTTIDQTEYNTLSSVVPVAYSFSDGATASVTTTRSIVYAIDHETRVNEGKRSIRLLEPTLVPQVILELGNLLK